MSATPKIVPMASDMSASGDQTVVTYFTPIDGGDIVARSASEHANTDTIGPLKSDLPFGAGDEYKVALVPKPKPMLRANSGQGSSRKLASHSTLHALTGGSTKTAMRARQNALIAKKTAEMTKKHSLPERLTYKMDLYISTRRGQTISLGIAGLGLMVIFGVLLQAAQPDQTFANSTWESWTFLADPGSHTSLEETGLRFIGAVTTLIGILYFSVIMGFVVDGIREKMDSLKKGKSKVAEDGHTLILGWTDKSISLIRQICLANESNKGGVIVVLAENEKEDLEAELASHLGADDLRGSHVVFRTGTPLLSVDLLKVAAHRAKSIVIMASSTGDADRSDAAVLRTVLSLKTLPELNGHIVAELRDIDNEPLLRLVGGDEVEILVSHDVIGRLVLMAARSPGLARVYTCLLGFEGNEFYFKAWPEVVGCKFRDLTERFPDAIPLGLKNTKGEVFVCPDLDTVVAEGDEILVLAEDDDTYKACPPAPIDIGVVPNLPKKPLARERILMCGWRRDIRDMIQLLDSLVLAGTEVHMVCEEPVNIRNKMLQESGLSLDTLKNIKLIHHYGNTAIRRHIEAVPLHTFTSIMILADQSREDDIMHSDSHSLASLLLLRDLQMRMFERNKKDPEMKLESHLDCKCISEILDPRTQKTISTSATILRLSEFIQSNELVSCILAMIAESRDVRVILDELLGPTGASFAIESATRYCTQLEQVSFWQLAKCAMAFNEIVCGYQLRGAVEETILNPPNKHIAKNWSGIDLIILRGQEEVVHHVVPAPPVHAEDFERTSRSRLSKSSFVRQQILEALVQEQELANIDQLNTNERDMLTRAVRSYVEVGNLEKPGGQVDTKTVRTLIAVSKLLVEALEKFEGVRIDEEEENVSEYDANSV